MTPEHIEALKIAVSGVTTLGFALAMAYLGYKVLTACDDIALIRRKLWDGEEKYE
jgi:hypothetical protein